jgi:hypothetical protein
MSSLTPAERRDLENLFGMSSGYVLTFTNQGLSDFVAWSVDKDIEAGIYTGRGSSKANRLREFWKVEDDAVVGKLLSDLMEYIDSEGDRFGGMEPRLLARCVAIASRISAGGPDLRPLKDVAAKLDAAYVQAQVRRMEAAIQSDPALAVGTAKEFIETVCTTILRERGKLPEGKPEVSDLTKLVLEELDLSPKVTGEDRKGAEYARRLLRNLGAIPNVLAELRNLHGTGHGKDAESSGIHRRHAELAANSAGAFCRFVVDAHRAQPPKTGSRE